ncbi:hypothetical protein CDV31_005239 [Fusarium ambrosium]|uniref:Uncharacterized protein n=1 Tax=Fusarium ambrosium TaxID=131363 RepID=A0A428UKH5_9HYPO|nr:hypothetical protein CDV31_005239 [Fusarium ambrosium]
MSPRLVTEIPEDGFLRSDPLEMGRRMMGECPGTSGGQIKASDLVEACIIEQTLTTTVPAALKQACNC